MAPRSLIPTLGILLAIACNAQSPMSCRDGMPDAGEACLQLRDSQSDELLAVGDVDGDGRADAVVLASSMVVGVGVGVRVQLGQADGTLAAAESGIEGPGIPNAAIGDADGDGEADVLLWWPGEENEPGEICAYSLDTDGLLVERWCHAAHLPSSWSSNTLFVGSLGTAGEPGFAAWALDEALMVVDPADRAVRSIVDLPLNLNGARPQRIGDFDGDGNDALLHLVESGELQLHGSEGLRGRIEIPPGMDNPVVGDFDGDGIDDFAVSGLPCRTFDAWVRRATGSTTTISFDATDAAYECSDLLTGDLDGDGMDELFIATNAGLVGVWGHRLADETEMAAERLDSGPRSQGNSGHIAVDLDGNGTDDVLRVGYTDVITRDGYVPHWITEIWVGEP